MANKNQQQQEKGIIAAEIKYHELFCTPKFGNSLLSLQNYIKNKRIYEDIEKCKKFGQSLRNGILVGHGGTCL